MTFRITLRMTLNLTFKTWDFRGDFEGYFNGSTGRLGEGHAVKLKSCKVQVWFSLQLKFNSLELDSEVGRLVFH